MGVLQELAGGLDHPCRNACGLEVLHDFPGGAAGRPA